MYGRARALTSAPTRDRISNSSNSSLFWQKVGPVPVSIGPSQCFRFREVEERMSDYLSREYKSPGRGVQTMLKWISPTRWSCDRTTESTPTDLLERSSAFSACWSCIIGILSMRIHSVNVNLSIYSCELGFLFASSPPCCIPERYETARLLF